MKKYVGTFLTVFAITTFHSLQCIADTLPEHVIFRTEQRLSTGLGGLSAMDGRCQAKAEAAGLDGTWLALLSASGSGNSARERLEAAGADGPFFNMISQQLADSLEELFEGNIHATIFLDEFGKPAINPGKVWTATLPDGSYAGSSYDDWTSFSGSARVGYPAATDGKWVSWFEESGIDSASLYCVRADREPLFTPPLSPATFTHTIFVSSAAYDGDLGGLDGADAKCQTLAQMAGMGGTAWKAILSDSSRDAGDRITIRAPVFDTRDQFIAADYDDLFDGGNATFVRFDENGNLLNDQLVWTGSHPDGSRYSTAGAGAYKEDWTSPSGYAMAGGTLKMGAGWLTKQLNLQPARLYCIDGQCQDVDHDGICDLDSAEDSEVAPIIDPDLVGGGSEIPEDDVDALLAEVAQKVPLPELFEFVGDVNFLTEVEFEDLSETRRQGLAAMTSSEFASATASEGADDTGDHRMMIVSADGRMFRERPMALPEVPDHITSTSVGGIVIPQASTPLQAEKNIWGGTDGRQLRTSAEWPWRALGVSLRIPSNIGQSDCSGSMIAPRVVLTSAHCVSPDGGPPVARRVAPAARGPSFAGEQFPFGSRFVEWYTWPEKWKGQHTARYDYALLILRDINWSPGYVFVGTRSGIAYTKHNTAGYPGNGHDCEDAPSSANGDCGGFMYWQYEKIRSAGDGYFFHQFDTDGGQSGSPIYYFESPSYRKVFGINEGTVLFYNTATRIVSGSFGLICHVIDGDFKYEIDGETRDARSSFFPDPHCD